MHQLASKGAYDQRLVAPILQKRVQLLYVVGDLNAVIIGGFLLDLVNFLLVVVFQRHKQCCVIVIIVVTVNSQQHHSEVQPQYGILHPWVHC